MSFGFDTKQIELRDSDWMESLTNESKAIFTLNGVKIQDDKTVLERILNEKYISFRINYPLLDDRDQVEYLCTGYRYKLQQNQVVGFAITNTNVSKNDVMDKLGDPTNITPIIGDIFLIDFFEIEGYIWEYEKLQLEITLDQEQQFARAFYVGKKLYYFDN